VHGREFVLNAPTTANLGLNKDNGGVFKELLNEVKSLKQENVQMKGLLIKLTADNSKMLQIERANLAS
jgi:hypothetical protein